MLPNARNFQMPVLDYSGKLFFYMICMNLSETADCDFKGLTELSSSVVDTRAIINSHCQITMLCMFVCSWIHHHDIKPLVLSVKLNLIWMSSFHKV